MASPRQLGFLDGKHPKSAIIIIKEKHELLRLTAIVPWPDLIDTAINVPASRVKGFSGPPRRTTENYWAQ